MTVRQAIARFDEAKPNTYTQEEKIGWLAELDGRIVEEIIKTHIPPFLVRENEDGVLERAEWTPYTTESLDAELIAPAPYDSVYISWLETMVDYANGEYARYQNSGAMFNSRYRDYERWYNRHMMPLGRRFRYF